MANGTTSAARPGGRIAAYFSNLASAPRTLERQFWLAFYLTVAICFVFWLGHYFEREILNRHPGNIRFIRDATEAGMRYITIPHIAIGFLFMVSALRNRNLRQRSWIVGLLLAGAVLCVGYYVGGTYTIGGAKANTFLMVSVYLFFLVHELRDEGMFYHALGSAPPIDDRPTFDRMKRAWIACLVLSAAAAAWTVLPLGFAAKRITWDFSSLSMAGRIGLAVAPLAAVAIFAHFVMNYFAVRLGHANGRGLMRAHAPFFRVSLGVLGVLGLSLLLTQRAYSLILFHVAGWYVFASYQFRRNPPKQAPRNWWLWMRTTVRGFKTLHIGLAVALMALGLVWTLGLGQTPYLAWLLAPESFLYWTIMHIMVSFVPK